MPTCFTRHRCEICCCSLPMPACLPNMSLPSDRPPTFGWRGLGSGGEALALAAVDRLPHQRFIEMNTVSIDPEIAISNAGVRHHPDLGIAGTADLADGEGAFEEVEA